MVKRARPAIGMPTLVAERLQDWGRCVRKQRVLQKMTAQSLCERLDISRPTLLRLEQGEGTVSAAVYLAALHILGALPYAAPALDPGLWQLDSWDKRARQDTSDDDYF